MLLEDIQKNLDGLTDETKKFRQIDLAKKYKLNPQTRGIKTGVIRKISRKFYQEVKEKSKEDIFSLCTELLKTGFSEEKVIAFDWAFRLKGQFEPSDFPILESWLHTYVEDWGACDDLCTHALGAFIYQYPAFIHNLKRWTASPNRWVRRAAAVSLIYSVRRGKYLEKVFTIADLLLEDADDMVQKGYGWMLKVATRHIPDEVFAYVLNHKKTMPRTSLRYAIEKLPPDKKKEAMRRDF
ncbi:MAG: DNA alkylation repair protein [Theionarchaea archaeon]|nr:DNA alkylation repair protein [Theionarchaea archaeon]